MSELIPYTIKCPKCEEEQVVELYESVNISEDATLKEQLLTNQLNRVRCGPCELDFRIDKHLLYSDSENRLMLYLMPCTLAELDQVQEQFLEKTSVMDRILPGDIEAPELTLVINRTELIEKIFLAEAKLNERLIEYIKYMIYVRNPDAANPRTHRLLFNAQDSTEHTLFFVVQNLQTSAFENALQYDRTAYTALAEALDASDDQAQMIMEMFPGPYISARAHVLREEEVEDENFER